jgi:hypothetical protein
MALLEPADVGLDRRGYADLFGPAPRQAVRHDVIETGFDHAATDTLLPHPFYAPLHWVCAVNPGHRTRARLGELPDLAHTLVPRTSDNRKRHRTQPHDDPR